MAAQKRRYGKRRAARGKPEGIPEIAYMVMASLDDAARKSLDGLAPIRITEYVRAKWWPHVDAKDIGPIVWRMWKRRQVEKKGSIYSRPAARIPKS